ncbi:hypothetical protein GCM10011410_17440 [Hoyosella rhizosphaerae]|uniref:Uncharacterized protein n=1 Tax=Hoyosella rhizosphaerae TaxID=1755582 RepID=A0A916XE82_9ACTN|nr:hypothetical protein GCM10011410_17440 [Hoyosella rhizosphaerae]
MWKYNRPIDREKLESFHRRLASGTLARRVVRTCIPAARDRWITEANPLPIDHHPEQLSADDVEAWISDKGHSYVSGTGPTWRMAVAELDTGGAIVSVVASHSVVDGHAFTLALTAAALGVPPRAPADPEIPPRWKVLSADIVQATRQIPSIAHALVALPGVLRFEAPRSPQVEASAAQLEHDDDIADIYDALTSPIGEFRFPGVSLPVSTEQWSARAQALGGTPNTLFMAIAASIAQRLGRTRPDGSVELAIPVSTRTPDDDRANAISGVKLPLDPSAVRDDLSPVRADLKQTLIAAATNPHPLEPLLPLLNALPNILVRKLANAFLLGDYTSVGCSNVGSTDARLLNIDGAPADHMMMTFVLQGYAPRDIPKTGGRLNVGIIDNAGIIRLRIYGFDPRTPLGPDDLRTLSEHVLTEWGLDALTW